MGWPMQGMIVAKVPCNILFGTLLSIYVMFNHKYERKFQHFHLLHLSYFCFPAFPAFTLEISSVIIF